MASVRTLLEAIREPTEFASRPPDLLTHATLIAGASLGIGVYAAAIHAAEGVTAMITGCARGLGTAGLAYTLAVPALVVLGALSGSSVPWRRSTGASLVAVNFGGLAFLASIPVVALLELTSPFDWTRPLVNSLVVVGVGGSSTLVFERAMAALEGRKLTHRLFMTVFGALFVEIAFLIDLFRFTR
ncbi:MAG: hypothetical protein ABMA64_28555 [Myxococcota bacterium]